MKTLDDFDLIDEVYFENETILNDFEKKVKKELNGFKKRFEEKQLKNIYKL
jgi:hypothetical protein